MRILPALLLALAAPAPAEPPALSECASTAVEQIQRHYDGLADLRAAFEQSTRSVALGRPGEVQSSRGEVVFAKPGRMRWDYREPEPSLVVSDGHWLWIYDPRRQEAQKLPLGEGQLAGSAIQFLLGEGRLLEQFRVRERACSAAEVKLGLWPREPSPYERLELTAELPAGRIRETELVDLLGNTTRVAFRELRENQGPAAALFEFSPPPGVEVIELTPPPAPEGGKP